MPSSPSSSPASDETTAPTPKSPRSVGGLSGGSQAFIYPIRSAVSVKTRTPGQSSSVGDNPQTPLSPSADERYHPELRRSSTRSSYGFPSMPPPPPSSRSDGPPVRDDVPSGESSKHSENTASSEAESSVSSSAVPLNGPDTNATDVFDSEERDELEQRTQMRFKHVQTDEGHMVLTGRDGVLLRCEDEVSVCARVRFRLRPRCHRALTKDPSPLSAANTHPGSRPILWLHGGAKRRGRRLTRRSSSV